VDRVVRAESVEKGKAKIKTEEAKSPTNMEPGKYARRHNGRDVL
jgi:hypothetical protein